jgi:hypothetical protein
MNPIRTVAFGALCSVVSHASAFFFANTAITTGYGPETSFVSGTGPGLVSSYLDRNYEHTVLGTTPGGITNVTSLGFTHSEALAVAGPGQLGVRAMALVDNRFSSTPLTARTGTPEDPGNGIFFTTPGASARMSTDDVRFNALPGVGVGSGPTVPVSLNLAFNGAFAADSILAPGAGAGSGSMTLSIRIRFGYVDPVTHNQFADFFNGSITATEVGGNVVYGAGSGLLAGFTGGSVLLTTPEFDVPVGLPISAELSLDLIGASESSGHRLESIMGNFDHTLSFPETGDVFNLPTGYTAEVPSFNVQDNGFTPVPEPETYAMVGVLGCIGWAVRRRLASR